MLIEKNDLFIKIQPELECVENSEKNITEFTSIFQNNYSNFKNDNLILDLTVFEQIDLKEILTLEPIIEEHISNKKSIVFVLTGFDIDSLPDHINVVPTEQEARDVIEMEEIERDLGF